MLSQKRKIYSLKAVLLVVLTTTINIVLFNTPVYAAQIVPVTNGGTYHITASKEWPNYLRVSGDVRLQVVSVLDTDATVKDDAVNGSVTFTCNGDKPFSMLATDDQGHTYSFTVTPEAITSQIIDLHPTDVVKKKKKKKKRTIGQQNQFGLRASNHKKQLRNTFVEAYSAFPPNASLQQVIDNADNSRFDFMTKNLLIPLWAESRLVQLVTMSSGRIEVDVFELTNISNEDMVLHESEFREVRPGLQSAHVDSLKLSPGEKTRVFLFYLISQ